MIVEKIFAKQKANPLISFPLKKKVEISPKEKLHKIIIFFHDHTIGEIHSFKIKYTREYTASIIKGKSDEVQQKLKNYLKQIGYDEATKENPIKKPKNKRVFESCWIANCMVLFADNNLIEQLLEKKKQYGIIFADLLIKLRVPEGKVQSQIKSLDLPPDLVSDPVKKRLPPLWYKSKICVPNLTIRKPPKNEILCAVIDRGFNLIHRDLTNVSSFQNGFSFFPFRPAQRYVPRDAEIDQHGTNCVSLIAGRVTGVAPNTKILPLTIFNDEMSFFKAIEFAMESNAQIISCSYEISSLSWSFYKFSAYRPSFRKALFRKVMDKVYVIGALFVSASGNDKHLDAPNHTPSPIELLKTTGYPSSVITVGGSDENDTVWNYSGRGKVEWNFSNQYFEYSDFPKQNELSKPEFTAPYCNIQACNPTLTTYNYNFTGTSASAPLVAGAICLMLENQNKTFDKIDHGKLLRALIKGADPTNGNELAGGVGRINVSNSLKIFVSQ